jgi:hypothetical protein
VCMVGPVRAQSDSLPVIKPEVETGFSNAGWKYDRYTDLPSLDAGTRMLVADLRGPGIIRHIHTTRRPTHSSCTAADHAAGGGGRSRGPVRADTEPHPAALACAYVKPAPCWPDRPTTPGPHRQGRAATPGLRLSTRSRDATRQLPSPDRGLWGLSDWRGRRPPAHRRTIRRVGTLLGPHDECSQLIWAIPA